MGKVRLTDTYWYLVNGIIDQYDGTVKVWLLYAPPKRYDFVMRSNGEVTPVIVMTVAVEWRSRRMSSLRHLENREGHCGRVKFGGSHA